MQYDLTGAHDLRTTEAACDHSFEHDEQIVKGWAGWQRRQANIRRENRKMQAHERTIEGNKNLTSLDKLIELVQVAILKSRNIHAHT